MVIISSSPIPGNENAISSTINMLLKQGADVFYESIAGVHVSGHAQREEIKMMINMIKPSYYIPVHGEYKQRIQNAKLAQSIGVATNNILLAQNGDILKLNDNMVRISNNINLQNIYIDGFGLGNTEDAVLKDRKTLSRNGIIFLSILVDATRQELIKEPVFVFKGIIYMDDFNEVLEQTKKAAAETVNKCFNDNITNSLQIESRVNDALEKFILKKFRIKPIILSKVIELKI
jgi:ribonuclease J